MHRYLGSESSNKREKSTLTVLRFKIPFERDAFGFNPFGTFRETTFRLEIRALALCVNHSSFMQANDTTSILRLRRST